MERKFWSCKEDYLCCKKYLEFALKRTSYSTVNELIEDLSKSLPRLPIGSIRMKIQNIKQITIEYKLNDGVEISPLANYSAQCKQEFNRAMEEVINEPDVDEPVNPIITTPAVKDFDASAFIGEKILSSKFGSGIVVKFEDRKYLTVRFSGQEKVFVVPISFNKGLWFEKAHLNDKVMEIYGIKPLIKFNIRESNYYRHDPVELSESYVEIVLCLEREIIEDLIQHGHMETCRMYWWTKKEILKKKYNIEWKSPEEIEMERLKKLNSYSSKNIVE